MLITGAAGRIGRTLVAGLAGRFELRLLDRTSVPDWPGMVVGGVNDVAVPDAAMAGVDVVVHLAGEPRVGAGWDSLREANIEGTHRVRDSGSAWTRTFSTPTQPPGSVSALRSRRARRQLRWCTS